MNKRIISAVFCLFLILGLLPGLARTVSAQSDTQWQVEIQWDDYDDHYQVGPDGVEFHLTGMNDGFVRCTEEVTVTSVCDRAYAPNSWMCTFDTSEAPFTDLEGAENAVRWEFYHELPAPYAIASGNSPDWPAIISRPTGTVNMNYLVTSQLEVTVYDVYTHELIGPADLHLSGTSALGIPVDLSQSTGDGIAVFAFSHPDWKDDMGRLPVGNYTMTVTPSEDGYGAPEVPVRLKEKFGTGTNAIRQFYFIAKQDKYHDLTIGKKSSETDTEFAFKVVLKSKLFVYNAIGKLDSEIDVSLSKAEVTWKKLDADGNQIESGVLSNCTHILDEADFWEAINALTPEERQKYRLKVPDFYTYASNQYTCVNAEETFTLKNGETIVFENLMEGTTFTVEETPLEVYQTTVEGQTDGEISSDVAVTFNNNRLIDISGSKT